MNQQHIECLDCWLLFIVNAYLTCVNYCAVNEENDFKDDVNDIEMPIESVSPANVILSGELYIDL